ncbi:antA/AntB antirepressor family protein [Anaerosinus massiliensis]|uniref:antA/AntB antirepressor family protein n=1 Tax=Massilibacillus massiliensis TaxID=1806837 RepID=UPI000DA61F48|nr:antA/AntB antirepressor family protein [Massilibacillus massiliensis]
MNQLIKIDESGKTTARELYEFLGLDITHYTRWSKTNIEDNEFAEGNKDYGVLAIKGENPQGGRPSKDYWLSIDFAKKLCMISKSSRGEQARNYFIEVEKRYKQQSESVNIAKLSPEMQMFNLLYQSVAKTQIDLLEMQERTETVERRLTLVKDTIIKRDDNWRDEINKMLRKIARHVGIDHQELRSESYKLLEERGKCDLNSRLRNLKKRLQDNGETKTRIAKANKLDVIESDPRLKEIYTNIVKEMTIRYVA